MTALLLLLLMCVEAAVFGGSAAVYRASTVLACVLCVRDAAVAFPGVKDEKNNEQIGPTTVRRWRN